MFGGTVVLRDWTPVTPTMFSMIVGKRNGVADRLADVDVVEGRLVVAELDLVDRVADDLLEVDVLEAHDGFELIRRHRGDHAQLPGAEPGDAGRALFDDLEDEALEVRLALLPVVRVLHQDDLAAGGPVLQHVGTGADRVAQEIEAELLDGRRGDDVPGGRGR